MPHKVSLSHLRLSDYRNYRAASLDLDPRHVVIAGDNGSGKTNLIEAISLLTPGRGLRRATLTDITRVDSKTGFSVFARLDGMEGEVEIGTGLGPEEEGASRKVRINSTPARSADELLDHCRILWLTPAMDGLFVGPASDRRRFLDRLVLSLDPAHGRRAADFEKAMRMRNKLLEDGRPDESWISGIEAQMASLGVAIHLARLELAGLLARLNDQRLLAGSFPLADIRLQGFLEEEAGLPALDLEERYLKLMRDGRWRDQAAGRTLDGPHRADLVIRHRQKDIDAALGSTGEQKALLVGLILSHARLVADLTGHAPILLLDEIAAHLDEGRRANLFDLIDDLGCQAFMTGTDASMFSAWGKRARTLSIVNGFITG